MNPKGPESDRPGDSREPADKEPSSEPPGSEPPVSLNRWIAPFVYGWTSIAGAALMVFGLIALAVAALTQAWAEVPYVGVAYIMMVALVGLGALLLLLGALKERRRVALGKPLPRARQFAVDLNRPSHRNLAFVVLLLGLLGLTAASTLGYQGVHAVESNQFCTQACHAVMAPEGEAHKFSGHSNVMCVDCHVGSGIGSFADAKVNGLRQVYQYLTNSYDRPIKTPIHTMGNAREICEGCHSPDYFKGFKDEVHVYYATDEESTEHSLRLLVKLGGKRPWQNIGAGIHYAMSEEHKVEFIARDRQRQDIAFVRMLHPDGTVQEWANEAKPLTEEEFATLPVRTVDCLDCHNRPAHRYRPPAQAVNFSLEDGKISRDLPYVKLKAVELLSVEYPTTEAALAAIAVGLPAYYAEEYPEIATEQAELITAAVAELQAVYQRNFFPSMGVSWKAYPENIGHRDWPGCFRCHNDEMVDKEGEAIFSDCRSCHVILQQSEEEAFAEVDYEKGRAFYHFGDEEEVEEFTLCSDCHTGDSEMYQ